MWTPNRETINSIPSGALISYIRQRHLIYTESLFRFGSWDHIKRDGVTPSEREIWLMPSCRHPILSRVRELTISRVWGDWELDHFQMGVAEYQQIFVYEEDKDEEMFTEYSMGCLIT